MLDIVLDSHWEATICGKYHKAIYDVGIGLRMF